MDDLRARSEDVGGLADEVHRVVLSPDAVQDEDRLVDLEVAVSDFLGGLHGHPPVTVRQLDLFGLLPSVL